ncbi:MAG TPA: EamA family transporter [Anaerolineales bacterium]|jgi:drug/metabolite transporter (DMT)-like permease|nr:EamA family transporter [Anaerolineales bacterium]
MKTKVWTALIALYIVWGSTYLAIRFAVETIPPFMSAGLRFVASGAILLIWRRAAGDPLPTRNQWKSLAIVGILLLLGGNGLVSFAEQRIASGVAALIVGTVPLWLVLIEALRPGGVKPNWQAIIGLLVGFGGIYLLIGPSDLKGGLRFDLIGTLAVVAASFLWSIGSIYSRGADVPKSTLMMTGGEMLMGSVALFIVSALLGEWHGFSLAQVSVRSWLGLAYLITFGSLIGFVSYGWLLQNAPVSLTATYAYVNPLVAVFLGNLFAQEPLSLRTLIAAGVIIGSVVFINTSKEAKIIQKDETAAPAIE